MPPSRADSLSPTNKHTLPFVYDVVIVGAGPCGLASAARLREKTPSALFTDEEHNRYHWINKHSSNATIKNSKTGHTRCPEPGPSSKPCENSHSSLLVLDSEGNTWLSKWNRLFSLLEISHLRSPMFFHPDPHDRDGLLAYCREKGRESECLEISGCIGKEISKHQMKRKRMNRKAGTQARPTITIDERDRKDYFVPPSDLFQDYCHWIAQRYGLCEESLVSKATVSDIDYDFVRQLSANEKLFTIRTDEFATYYARSVVLAIGAGGNPMIPKPFPQSGCPCASHAFQSTDGALTSRVRARKPTNILVIGGGLTSAQVADRAIRRGASRVYHLMRGPMKVKPFDVDLSWMGKFRNHEKASFWSADTDEERAELVRTARGGGSITPRFAKILEKHVKTGKLSVHTHTTVISQRYSPLDRTYSIETDPPIVGLPDIHFVYFATGIQGDFQKLPYLSTMVDKHPIRAIDGLPALTDDLMWSNNVPLFMTGRLAALRLGPGAGNLEGARLGAERIAWGLQNILAQDEAARVDGSGKRENNAQIRYLAGIGSRFEALNVESS